MKTQSKWVLEDHANQVVRASTIKPRIDYATETLDVVLEILVQERLDLNRSNLDLYRQLDGTKESMEALEGKVRHELEIAYAIESLRQVRRSIDSIAGMGNVPTILSPDPHLGELSLLLSGVIIDAAYLASLNIDFEKANSESKRLLEEAKLSADLKICRQFHNLEL